MPKDSQSRKWQITINNPAEKGFSHERIRSELLEFKSCVYWCMSDEIGDKKTYHTHIFMACSSAVRFSKIQKHFEGGHFEMARGTSQQNRDYVFKEGKWEKDRKRETNLTDTHEEFGEMPMERPGARNDLSDLYDMIKSGYTNFDILEVAPQYLMCLDKIERVRQTVREEKCKSEFRKLSVTYIFGATGTGKTRSVMEKYGYQNVYRVTDYAHPFDAYKGQEILIFDEFRSSLPIQDMLNYLDGYPLQLPCRYNNRVACFTEVYIITNIQLESQYKLLQREYPETWEAFLRRIHSVFQFMEDGARAEYLSVKDYLGSGPLEHVFKEEK